MSDTYAQLLDALGFNAADAARQVGGAQRSLESTTSRIRMAGEDERDSIKASAEGRGVISSGEYAKSVARQRAREASDVSMAETGTADRVAAINRELQRAQAQRQLQDEQRSAERSIVDQQFALQQSMLAQSAQQQAQAPTLDLSMLFPSVSGPQPASPAKSAAQKVWGVFRG
jgi:hypothetical protein